MTDRKRTVIHQFFKGKNEDGAVMVELGLILPLMAVMILFLLVCYRMVDDYIEMQVGTWADLRRKCHQIEYKINDNFQYVQASQNRLVVIEGTLPRVIGVSFVPLEVRMSTYAGSWKGRGKSVYHRNRVRYSF